MKFDESHLVVEFNVNCFSLSMQHRESFFKSHKRKKKRIEADLEPYQIIDNIICLHDYEIMILLTIGTRTSRTVPNFLKYARRSPVGNSYAI